MNTGTWSNRLFMGNPDRDPANPLTVDVLVEIDGTTWAVDHCLVSALADLSPSLKRAEKKLAGPLKSIAQSTNTSLHVLFQSQATTNRTDQQITDYYDEVIDIARQAPDSPGGITSSQDGSIVVQAYADPRTEVSLAPGQDTKGSWIIEDQVRGGLEAALEKKLSGQLKRAKAGRALPGAG